jgi:serine protease Do
MIRRSVFCFVLMCIAGFAGFGQASAIRDYVGMISQNFHPDTISFLDNLKRDLDKRGRGDAAKALENYIKGESGTGFVYRAADGKNYIITNFHVISQAQTLTVMFEKPDGERTLYSDLTIVAADEDMDIALLAFAGGHNPFRQGLAFLNRPVQDGDDVYSAGFPGFGTVMLWQLGRGIVSNSFVRIPDPEDDTKIFGPYIQHTAQVDPGNSGGPLLIQAPGVPTGFAVAGINTLSALRRQGANFSIPMNRVQTFLDTSLRPSAEDSLTRLNARLDTFIEGLGATKTVYYPHIADYLSNACVGENVEYAWDELKEKASVTAGRDIVDVFNRSPVDGMTYFVAWLIEHNLRPRSGTISITKESVIPEDDGRYKVTFNVNNKSIDSEWVNEYGIWRIRTFGEFASGDKTMVEKKKKATDEAGRLVTDPTVRLGAGVALVTDLGTAFEIDVRVLSNKFFGGGMQGIIGPEGFAQFDILLGFYIPIQTGPVAFTPFGEAALGLMFSKNPNYEPDAWSGSTADDILFTGGVSVKGGLMFTTVAVPGLYLQAAYQYNFHRSKDWKNPPRSAVIIGLGYSFN